MPKKLLIYVAVAGLALAAGLFFWARAVFTQENVRVALAERISGALGQPVSIGTIGATVFPRVTVNLSDVTIGTPARITIQRLQVGSNLRALLSRRIEHADLRLTGARIELPLPELTFGSDSQAGGGAAGPVELVSIDEIELSDVHIVSGGRTLRGDFVFVPQGNGMVIREATLRADDASIKMTGTITDLAGPSGELTVNAGKLNLDELLVFVSDFSAGAGTTTARKPDGAPGVPMKIAVALAADSAKIATLTLERLAGTATVTSGAVTLDPIGFGLFGGKYSGALRFSTGKTTGFHMAASLADIDMAQVMTFVGSPGTLTGRLTGRVDLSGAGMDADAVMKSAKGTARVDITDGTIRNLGLVRTIVIAGSGRSDANPQAEEHARDEQFTRLGATLAVVGGDANTSDLQFESSELLLTAAGYVRLDGSSMDLRGQAQLSDALAARAGRDLVRYTQEQGRPTLPVVITGSADAPQVTVDMTDVLRRAIANRAKEEVQGAIKRRLGGLFQK